MRTARRVLVGMVVAAVANVPGLSVVTKPAVADDMTTDTMDMPMDMDMTTATCTWGVSLSISAERSSFDKDCLAAPPGEKFTISFENRDPVAHNIVILPTHESSEVLFRGETISGPGSVTYSVGPLSLGRYHFHCETHPTTMMGTFALGGPAAFTSPGGMMMMSSPPGTMMPPADASKQTDEGASPVRTFALVAGIGLLFVGGLFLASRSRRRARRTDIQTKELDAAPAATAFDANVGRRQLVRLGAAGVAGAALAKLATGSPASADERLGGIHISVLTHGVSPEVVKGFPHHWTMTVYGPDNALSGMGWGGATDLKTAQDVFNSKMFPCIFSLTGAVEGDVVKVHGLMLFSGAPDQGLPLTFEGNLKTGSLHVNAYNAADFEGTGLVARV